MLKITLHFHIFFLENIPQVPSDAILRLNKLVDGSIPDMCIRVGPSYEKYAGERLSYCYSLEFTWHVLFGERNNQPLRADDPSVPMFLRWKDNEEVYPRWRDTKNYSVMRASYEKMFHKEDFA